MPASILLAPGQLLRCARRRAVWLRVLRGRVWLTWAQEPGDHFLDAGACVRVPGGTQALLGAEGAAEVLLEDGPAPEGRATVFAAAGRPSLSAASRPPG